MERIFMFSECGEDYYGKSSTQLLAIHEAVRELGLRHGDTVFVSEMRRVELPPMNHFLDVDQILESADDHMADNYGVYYSLFDLDQEHLGQLQSKLDDIWVEFFMNRPDSFMTYYEAIDPTKIEIDPEHIIEAGEPIS